MVSVSQPGAPQLRIAITLDVSPALAERLRKLSPRLALLAAALLPLAPVRWGLWPETPDTASPKPPQASAPDAAQPMEPCRSWATPARRAVLREHWPAGTPIVQIRAMLEALPGKELPGNQPIASMAIDMGLQRPAGFDKAAVRAPRVRRKAAP